MYDSYQRFPTPLKFPVKNMSDVPGGPATFFDDAPQGRAKGLSRAGLRTKRGEGSESGRAKAGLMIWS